ncbi:MAG: hypothetical protein KBF88_16725 [Polyangiaceae bacterium]|nr:hypothetical protein [Polyangiaceae bacterium]
MQPPKGPEAALKSKLLLFLKGEPSELDAILAHTAMAAGIAGIFGHFGHLHQNVPWLPVLVFVVSSLWHGFELDRGRAFPEVRAMVAYTAIVAVGGGVLLQDNAIEAGRIGSIYGGFVLALLFGGSNVFVSVLHETIQRFTCSKLFSTEDTKSRNAALFGIALSLVSWVVTRTSLYRESLYAEPSRLYDLWPLLGLVLGSVAILRTQRRLALREQWFRNAKEGKIPGIRLEERVETGDKRRFAVVAHETESVGAYREALHEEELLVWHEEPSKNETKASNV